jgi:tRNA pseudouridine synthase 10
VCRGKGCPHCDGKGKLYRTSVQELIERPLLKATGSKRSKFSGLGREDVDARCLGWRPFVLEMLNPRKRQINLRKIQREINRSKLVQVKELKWVDKSVVRKVKSARADKTYLAIVDFQENIDKAKLAKLKVLEGAIISQRTPLRVLHRRADKVRRRIVKSLKVKVLGKKRLQVRVRAQAGLYVKEFIDGDYGRTSPSIAELLGNPPKRITLDVVQIHEGFGW